MTGHAIADHDDGDGTVVTILETVTVLERIGNMLHYTNENGVTNTIPIGGNGNGNGNLVGDKKTSDLHYIICTNSNSYIFAGEIKILGHKATPNGWLPCDGRELGKTDFPELFNLLGYKYGGSGTIFKLPELNNTSIVSTF